VLLVFNRGFTRPFCRRHMAQLRRDYTEFVARDVEVVVVGPEDAPAFADYWRKESLPFVGLPDARHTVLKRYGQEVKLFKLGRMPAQVLIDKAGVARFVHYGHSMSDIPENAEVLALVDEIEASPTDIVAQRWNRA
jgi:peroxiredoxin